MKNLFVGVFLCSAVVNLSAQKVNVSTTPNQASGVSVSQDSSYTVVERGVNDRVWQRTVYESGSDGKLTSHSSGYTELATGMHYKDPQTGEWLESKEQIEINPNGGGQAIQGQHQVYFPYDIYDGVIELVTPDGKHLKSRPSGISYYDGTNSVLIAELQHSVGQILPSGNQVIYTNAFSNFSADIIATYKRSGFECDLVFHERPSMPETFGMQTENCQLGLLTEFFDTDDPVQTEFKTDKEYGFEDAEMSFGAMTMVHGKAFETDGETNGLSNTISKRTGISVAKTWATLQGRKFLIEEVPVSRIEPKLNILPAGGASIGRTKRSCVA